MGCPPISFDTGALGEWIKQQKKKSLFSTGGRHGQGRGRKGFVVAGALRMDLSHNCALCDGSWLELG
jgi:hypothetical protein